MAWRAFFDEKNAARKGHFLRDSFEELLEDAYKAQGRLSCWVNASLNWNSKEYASAKKLLFSIAEALGDLQDLDL